MLWRSPKPAARATARATVPCARTKFLGVGERQLRVIASDGTADRMGDVLEPTGARLANYRRNPIILAQHDAQQPIARCSHIAIENAQVVALIEFPPSGTSARSDEYLALAKAGILGAVSVGFMPISFEPRAGGGMRFTTWELLEISIVSVPANPSAVITERSFRRANSNEKPIGNCGRPIGKECGLINVAECQIHGTGEIGFGDGDSERAIRLRRARAIRRRLDLVPEHATRADRERVVVELRAAYGLTRRASAAVQVADAAWRLGRS